MNILAMIQAIIQLPSAINALGDKIAAIVGAIQEQQKQAWMNQVNEVLNEGLKKAQSREDFQNLAKQIQDLTSKL